MGRLDLLVRMITIVSVPTVSNSPVFRRVIQLVYRRCCFYSLSNSQFYLCGSLCLAPSRDTNRIPIYIKEILRLDRGNEHIEGSEEVSWRNR